MNIQVYKGKEGHNQESGLAYRVAVMGLMRVYLDRSEQLFVGTIITHLQNFFLT